MPIRFRLALIALTLTAGAVASDGRPEVESRFTIHAQRSEYCAWPAIARARNGDILVTYTRTEEHLGPDGQILLSRSTDQGQTWEAPVVIYDSPLDDRESGLTSLRDGRLLVHLRSVRWTPTHYAMLPADAYEQPVLNRWITQVDADTYRAASGLEGAWHAVSQDHGHTWSEVSPGKDSVHGGIERLNGSLLVASYREDGGHIGIYQAKRPQDAWTRIATVRCPRPQSLRFGEPHVLQLPSGRIVMLIRATAIPYDDGSPECRLWSAYSDDDGHTWSAPYETPLWGFPPHLTPLADGRVLATYGYRRRPYGIRAAVSANGITWDQANEVVLVDDAPNKDLGYPVSLELEPGRILTVYYQPEVPLGAVPRMQPPDPHRIKPGIHGMIWQTPAP